jgi:hypothetical protein
MPTSPTSLMCMVRNSNVIHTAIWDRTTVRNVIAGPDIQSSEGLSVTNNSPPERDHRFKEPVLSAYSLTEMRVKV